MSCSHTPAFKCIECAPDLWNPSKEWEKEWHIDHWMGRIARLLLWRKSYYSGGSDHPDDDHVYDNEESYFREKWPEHPILRMVDWDEEMKDECIEYTFEKIRHYPNES